MAYQNIGKSRESRKDQNTESAVPCGKTRSLRCAGESPAVKTLKMLRLCWLALEYNKFKRIYCDREDLMQQ